MKKIILIALLLIASLSLGACTSDEPAESTDSITQNLDEILPARPADINGNVRSIEGNEVIVANELKEALSEEEQAAQKAERQALSQEERQAARQELMETVETQTVTITIPVGIPIYKTSGTGDGDTISAELSGIKSDTYISAWMEDDQVIAVKIKGSN